jgi:hypothetical protein
MGSPRLQLAALGASVIALGIASTALAENPPPPPPPPGTPSIGQYVETVPTSNGGAAAGAGRKHAKLPPKVAKAVRAHPDAVTKRLESVATSSAYGAPQRDLTPQGEAKAAGSNSGNSGPAGQQPKTPASQQPKTPAPKAPKAANPLSAAVSAVGDSGDSHVFWLLGAVIVVTTAMVWATARRHRA